MTELHSCPTCDFCVFHYGTPIRCDHPQAQFPKTPLPQEIYGPNQYHQPTAWISDARATGQPCGPAGNLWQPRRSWLSILRQAVTSLFRKT